jgi:5-methylcytosine-specific restriction endonuclease McrA
VTGTPCPGRSGHDMRVSRLDVDFCCECGWVPTGVPTSDEASPFRRKGRNRSSRLLGIPAKRKRHAEIIARDGTGDCHYCGVDLAEDERTIDEKQPRSRGGFAVLDNQVIACPKCNVQKGAMTYEAFMAKMAK